MGKDLNRRALPEEEVLDTQPHSPEEVERIVVMARLELYNRSLPCGAVALRKHLDESYHLNPLPSIRTIMRMLDRHGLTHGRTDSYAEEAS
jgi:putative transposase